MAERLNLARQRRRLRIERHYDIGVTAAPAGDDVAQMLDDAIVDSDLKIALAVEFTSFFAKLPAELVEDTEPLRQARGGSFEEVLANAASSLKAHLGQEGR